MYTQMQPTGTAAAALRRRKAVALRRFHVPPEALPGSLALTYRRCGRPNCWCAAGRGHPLWSLTFMADGRKRVEPIPVPWVLEVRRRVEQGREVKRALAAVLAANAQLLALARRQRRH